MDPEDFDVGKIDISWCPGCGNYSILPTLKEALAELEIDPRDLVIVSGIGQAAKTPQYLKTNFFNGLHGRSLPVATAIKASNPSLTVIAESGDGCMYGEGGNHMLNAIRRNSDLTCLVHNNMVYGLTKGQASPTSPLGFRTSIQTGGVSSEPYNPIATAVALDCSFVGRAFSGDRDQLKEIVKKAIRHRGFALVDIFQPCVSYNRVNSAKWFKENTYYLDNGHDPSDRLAAFSKAIDRKLPLGVIYTKEKPTFEESLTPYRNGDRTPLFQRSVDLGKLASLLRSFR
jgi:2-oxoglutarate ferredoxin oxidoreductase subunit beta